MSVDPSNNACDKWPATSPFFGGPFPTRTWSRDSGPGCTGTAATRALAHKTVVLQYKKNSARLTNKQKWAQLAKGKSHNKKQAWASQTSTVTNPNVNNLPQKGLFSLCCGLKNFPLCCSITNISLSSIAVEAPANTFTFNGNLTIETCSILTIDTGITFIFASGVIVNTGRIINNGTFVNNVVFPNGINNSNGILTNNGTFDNNGYLNNDNGKINNTGTFTNNALGTIDNQGPLSCWSGTDAVDAGGGFTPALPGFYPGSGCA